MRFIVQKFGGTSVADAESREKVAEKVAVAVSKGMLPIVVVSAMGRPPSPYATDSLLALLEGFEKPLSLVERDLLLSCGEALSCVVVAHLLRDKGFEAQVVDAVRVGLKTSETPGEGVIEAIDPSYLLSLLREGVIPVVAGFQGLDKNLRVVTLGRGGSDTTAVALGAAIRARYVQIYTDVEGVMSCDPRVYEGAELLSEVDFEEMGELTKEGAKVVHPRAVDLASEYAVPLWVKSTFSQHYGTFISPVMASDRFEKTRIVSAIAHVKGLCQLAVPLLDLQDVAGMRVKILKRLAKIGVNLDLVHINENQIRCIFSKDLLEDSTKVIEDLGLFYQVRKECAKISVVGSGMRGTPGVMARLLDAFHQESVEILYSTDSNITISFLVWEKELKNAIEAVHKHIMAR